MLHGARSLHASIVELAERKWPTSRLCQLMGSNSGLLMDVVPLMRRTSGVDIKHPAYMPICLHHVHQKGVVCMLKEDIL